MLIKVIQQKTNFNWHLTAYIALINITVFFLILARKML